MSTTDKRIVELEFDNKSFEAGVRTTLESLRKLDNDLDKIDGKSLNGLQDSLNNLSFKGMENGIESLNDKFSFFGNFAREIVQNIANDVYNAGKQFASSTLGQIMSGGSKRSLNISQAKFTFKGLGLDIEEAMKDANAAVDGTAYGLDEAAVAASQFAASGVKLGKEMTTALQGVSGVAAMTGSEFSDISRIFATVAGNGRLMGQQLTQLGQRGLNVAATMAKDFGVTEEAFRDMVSDKNVTITFEQFYKSMQKNFWSQAAKANDLYTGALANFKSALGRIGQPFYDVYYETARQVLNTVRPILNKFKQYIGDTYTDVENIMADVTKKIVGSMDIINKKGNVKVRYRDEFEKIGQIVNNLFHSVFQFSKLVINLFKSINEGFRLAFPESILSFFVNITGKLREFLENANEAGTVFEWLRGVSENFFLTVRHVTDIAKNLWAVVGPLFNNILIPAGKWLISTGSVIIEEIAKKLAKITSVFQNFEKVEIFGSTIGELLAKAKEGIEGFTEISAEKIRWFFGELDNLSEFFGKIWESIKRFASNTFDKVIIFFGRLGLNLRGVKKEVSDNAILDGLKKIFSSIKEFFSSIKFSDIFHSIGTFFTNVKNSIVDFYNIIKPVLQKAAESFKPFLSQLKEMVGNTLTGKLDENLLSGGILATLIILVRKVTQLVKSAPIKAIREGFLGVLKQLQSVLEAYQKNINAQTLWTIAKAIGVLALSIFGLALIDTEKLIKVATVLGMLGGILVAFLKFAASSTMASSAKKASAAITTIASGIKDFFSVVGSAIANAIKIDSLMLAMDLFAFAILEMATTVAIIAGIDKTKLWDAVGVTGILFATLGGMFAAIVNLAERLEMAKVGQLAGTAAAFGLFATSMATSVFILAGAMALMSLAYTKDGGGFILGAAAIVGFIATMTYAFKMLDNFSSTVGRMVGLAISFTIFASTLAVMGVGLAAIGAGLAIISAIPDPWSGTAILIGVITAIVVSAQQVKENLAAIIALSAGMAIFSASMLVLSTAMGIISLMSWESLAKFGATFVGVVGTIVLAITALAGVAKLLERHEVAITRFGKTVLLFGVAIAAFGVGVLSLAAAIGILAAMAPLIATAATAAAKGFVAFVTELANGADQLGAAVLKIIESVLRNALTAFKNIFSEILPVLGEAILSALDGLVKYVPGIVEKLADLIVLALQSLAKKVPDLVDAVFELLQVLGKAIGDKLKNISAVDVAALIGLATGLTIFFKVMASLRADLKKVIPVAVTMGLVLAGLVAAFVIMDELEISKTLNTAASLSMVVVSVGGIITLLSKFGVDVAAAAKAALAVGVAFDILVFIIGGLVAILGMLDDLVGLQPALEKGVEILGLIGEAIGNFVGKLVGGVIEGVSTGVQNALVNVAQGLADFWTTAKPFFDGLANLPEGVVESAQNIASAVLTLAASDFLDAVSKILGGGDLTDLGTQLSSLSEAMKTFFADFEDWKIGDLKKLKLASQAASAISEIATNIPRTGGKIDEWFGVKDPKKFSKGITAFGKALVSFSSSVAGLEEGAITQIKTAADAGIVFADMMDKIPPTKGLWQKLSGIHDVPAFTQDINTFLGALSDFAENAKKVAPEDLDQINNVADVGKKLAEFVSILALAYSNWLNGFDRSSDTQETRGELFGKDLIRLIVSIKTAALQIKGLSNDETILDDFQTIVDICDKFIGLTAPLENNAGLVPLIKGYKDLGPLITELGRLGPALNIFMTNMSQLKTNGLLDKEMAQEALDLLDVLSNISTKLPEPDTNAIDTIATAFSGKSIDSKSAYFVTRMIAIADGIRKFSIALDSTKWDAIKNTTTYIGELMDSLAKIDEKSLDISAKVATSISTMVEKGLNTVSEGFAGSFERVIGTIKELFSRLAAAVEESVQAFQARGYEYGFKFSQGLAEGFGANAQALMSLLKQFFGGLSTTMFTYGLNCITKFSEGMRSLDKVSSVIVSLNNMLEGAFPTIVEKWYNLGVNSMKGFINGMNLNQGAVISKAQEIANNVYRIAADALKVESPSKKFTYLGEMSDKGWAIGLDKYSYLVYNSSEKIGNTLLDAVRQSVEATSEEFNGLDMSPTITPVIDLSNIQNGVSRINGLLGNGGYQLGISSLNFSRGVSGVGSSYDLRSTYDDGNVIRSIKSLADQVDILGDRIEGLQLVLDSGALVGEIAPDMNNALGGIQRKIERGIMA